MRFLSRRRVAGAALIVPLVLGVWAWRAASWRPKVARLSLKPILALAWTGDGRTIQAASEDGFYRVLSSATLGTSLKKRISGHWRVTQFSADGGSLILGGESGIEEWSTAPWKRARGHLFHNDGVGALSSTDVAALATSARGDTWAVAETFGNDGTVWVWDVRSGHVQVTSDDKACAYADFADTVTLSSNGGLVAYGGETLGIGVWSKQTHKRLWNVDIFTPKARPKAAAAMALCFSPDGQQLAAAFLSGEKMLLNSRTGTLVRTLAGTTSGQCLAFSPDGHLLAWGGDKGELKVWNVATGQAIIAAPSGSKCVGSLAFSPDGRRLAVGTELGQVQLWRVR